MRWWLPLTPEVSYESLLFESRYVIRGDVRVLRLAFWRGKRTKKVLSCDGHTILDSADRKILQPSTHSSNGDDGATTVPRTTIDTTSLASPPAPQTLYPDMMLT